MPWILDEVIVAFSLEEDKQKNIVDKNMFLNILSIILDKMFSFKLYFFYK